jgi:hypothetical protein
MNAKRDPLKGVPGHPAPLPVVLMTVWRPESPYGDSPAPPMSADPYADDERQGWGPVR